MSQDASQEEKTRYKIGFYDILVIFVSAALTTYSNLSQGEVNHTQNPAYFLKYLISAKLPSQPPSYALAKLVDATNAQWAKMARKYLKYRRRTMLTRGLYTLYLFSKSQKTFFQGAFFLKFWPYVWLVFKSGF